MSSEIREIVRGKRILASELRTKEWEDTRMAGWVHERAFVMAGVVDVEILQGYRDVAARYAGGEYNAQDARRAMREVLATAEYVAEPALGGTIKDLSSVARMNVVLEMNTAAASGYKEYLEGLGNVDYPGLELYRAGVAAKPRDWEARWAEAAARVGYVGVARSRAWLALRNSPVWAELSRWGSPYPPFDYNSKMGVLEVSWDECEAAGLVASELATVANEQPSSFNAGVEMRPSVTSRDLADKLSSVLDGVAKVEWEGGTPVVKFVDRNGSQPYSAKELVDVWASKPPRAGGQRAMFTNYQEEALKRWVENSSDFVLYDGQEKPGAGLDMVQDMNMLVRRLEPMSVTNPNTPVYRGMGIKESDLNDILDKGLYKTRTNRVAESWTTSEGAARSYASAWEGSESRVNVILQLEESGEMKNIQPLVRHVRKAGGVSYPDVGSPPEIDNEVLGLPGKQYKVKKTKRDGNTMYITLAL